MKDSISIRQWQKNFQNGDYNNPDFNTQVKAGWWDWFCRDSSLANKTKRMGKIVAQIKDGGKVDLDKNYVWFKNNCPMAYGLYDDFRIANLEDGEVQMTIVCGSTYPDEDRYMVYGRKEKHGEFLDEPLFRTKSSRELIKWLNTAW